MELKPCPFCGSKPSYHKIRRPNEDGTITLGSTLPDSHYKWEYLVECDSCMCSTGPWMKTKQGAANKWNRRK